VHKRYRQTDRQMDGRQHIANVNVTEFTSRSLKVKKIYVIHNMLEKKVKNNN